MDKIGLDVDSYFSPIVAVAGTEVSRGYIKQHGWQKGILVGTVQTVLVARSPGMFPDL